jgi:hypothetical protein
MNTSSDGNSDQHAGEEHSLPCLIPAEAGLFLVNELNRRSPLPSYFLSEGAAPSSPLFVWEDTVPTRLPAIPISPWWAES